MTLHDQQNLYEGIMWSVVALYPIIMGTRRIIRRTKKGAKK
jgi:hypothetical protein